jgi:MerR family copper efflux transcriptional regulator
MNIGQAAAASGVSAKMIRYYESIGLVRPAGRSASGYRVYDASDVNTLRFVRRARDLGFPVERIRQLLDLWRDRARANSEVKELAAEQVAALAQRIAELEAMRRTLLHLVHACHGDGRPDCPILEDLATTAPGPAAEPESRRPAARRRAPPSAPGHHGASARRSAAPPAGRRP